jgi:hypothetical protein
LGLDLEGRPEGAGGGGGLDEDDLNEVQDQGAA